MGVCRTPPHGDLRSREPSVRGEGWEGENRPVTPTAPRPRGRLRCMAWKVGRTASWKQLPPPPPPPLQSPNCPPAPTAHPKCHSVTAVTPSPAAPHPAVSSILLLSPLSLKPPPLIAPPPQPSIPGNCPGDPTNCPRDTRTTHGMPLNCPRVLLTAPQPSQLPQDPPKHPRDALNHPRVLQTAPGPPRIPQDPQKPA